MTRNTVLMLILITPLITWAHAEPPIDFARDIQPIFQQHCTKCHGDKKQQGGLRFDSRGGAIRRGDSGQQTIYPGKAEQSELIARVTSRDDDMRMPPEGEPLTAEQIELLRQWINEGATWPEAPTATQLGRKEMVVTDDDRQHWSFRPLRKVDPPVVMNSQWVRTPIDQFILAKLEAAGEQPTPPLSRHRLVRRLYFDVIGLPPEGKQDLEIEALVDNLLASEHYGERWGRHWLDVARYADSNGQEGDQDRPNAYRYRDFVIRALNDDLPYDTFVRWQLAGDEIAPGNAEAIAATGFLTAGPSTVLNVPMEDEKLRNRYNELDDMLSTIGTGMLGLTLGCARCHDHKYDAIPSRDYYRMMSAVHNGDRAEVPLVSPEEFALYQRHGDDWDKQVKAVESRLNDWLAANKRPIEAPLRNAKIASLSISDQEKAVLRDQPDTREGKKLAKKHAEALRVRDDDIRREMTDEQQQQWDELARELKELRDRAPQAPPMAFAFREFGPEPKPTWLFQRGDFYDRDEPVQIGFLSVLTSGKSAEDYFNQARAERPVASSSYQRRAMAEWITDLEHGAGALLARVIVNRVWQHHFGEGLVSTVSDFGVQGERPSHPELLEWLAYDFVRGGFKLKRLHRMILTSGAYQQSAKTSTPRRLEAEVLRDSMLAVSGTLNRQAYGPAFKPQIAPEAMVARNLKDPYPANVKESPDTLRRSVYMFHKRVVPYPLLQAFDAPDAAQGCGRRDRTTVAPQALALFNDQFVRDRAVDFADRLIAGQTSQAATETKPLIIQAYELAFHRPPTSTELAASIAFIQSQHQRRQSREPQKPANETHRQAVADFCQTLFALNEFIYVD